MACCLALQPITPGVTRNGLREAVPERLGHGVVLRADLTSGRIATMEACRLPNKPHARPTYCQAHEDPCLAGAVPRVTLRSRAPA